MSAAIDAAYWTGAAGPASALRDPLSSAHADRSRKYALAWRLAALSCVVALSACGTFSGRSGDRASDVPRKRGGGYYLDDGPGDNPPPNLEAVADAVPRLEPLQRGTARPYSVMGRTYTPMTQLGSYRSRGIATWYGRRYHGQPTSSGEIYDMYAMTAAHPVLAIPSYARVTNLSNGRSVVVRINDRGPFLADRIIDLSYVAAYKLDILRGGSARVEVEAIVPGSEPAPAPAVLTAEEPMAAIQPPIVSSPMAATPSPAAAVSAAPAVYSQALAQVQTPPLPESPAAAQANIYYVQLGAFSMRDNAERFMQRMRIALGTFDATLSIVSSENLHRVHAGPYENRDRALAAAEQIGQSLGATPLLVGPR